MNDKRRNLQLPDILGAKRNANPDLDPDDIVEVYGPAEMLGAIGGIEEPTPDDVSNEAGEFDPTPLYGPTGFLIPAPLMPSHPRLKH